MTVHYVKKGQFFFITSFLLMIAAGTFLLMLPCCAPQEGFSWSHALFTATSAVCVTGLTIHDLNAFGWAGQVLILLMIQIGGIGIMALSAAILISLGKGLSFSNTLLLSGLNDNFSLRGTENLTRIIVRYSLICEACGAFLIYCGLMFGTPEGGFGVRNFLSWRSYLLHLWNAVFIAVSSFCNAGFSPLPQSLARTNEVVKYASAALTILGGLGIYVVYDLNELFRKRKRCLRLHTKLVLSTSAILLAGGTALFLLLNRDNPLSFTDAFFLSSSCRTCGFSTFDVRTQLEPGGAILAIILMFIGGSPGSTAGGIKTTTLAVIFGIFRSTVLGRTKVFIFKRDIGITVVMRAFTIVVLFLMLFCIAGAALCEFVPENYPLLPTMFEAASALSTTGLSMGCSSVLSEGGRLFMVMLMFIGRMGPFMLLLFLLGREKPEHLSYPEERIIIG